MISIHLLVLLSFINGFVTIPCNFDVRLSQTLQNQGFHRNITYTVTFTGGSDLYEKCYVGLNQLLPAGLYAYPEELGDLRRINKLTAIPKNRVNVELLAEQSQATSVFIISQVMKGEANLWLPVHARYHRAAKGGGYVQNNIESPQVFLRCQHTKLECEPKMSHITFLCDGSGKDTCVWKKVPVLLVTEPILSISVPVGSREHNDVVAPATAGVVIMFSLYLLKTLHDYKIAIMKKGDKL